MASGDLIFIETLQKGRRNMVAEQERTLMDLIREDSFLSSKQTSKQAKPLANGDLALSDVLSHAKKIKEKSSDENSRG